MTLIYQSLPTQFSLLITRDCPLSLVERLSSIEYNKGMSSLSLVERLSSIEYNKGTSSLSLEERLSSTYVSIP